MEGDEKNSIDISADKAISMEEPFDEDGSDGDEVEEQPMGPQQLAAILAEAKRQNIQDLSLVEMIKKANQASENPSPETDGENGIACPPQICDLASLTQLNLSSNSLSSLPPLFGLLGSLTDLNLSKNRLSSLPSSFSRLENLQVLNLSSNFFSSLPEECISPKLVSLNIDNNQVEALPAELSQMAKLRTLRLGGNGLKELPAIVGQLTELEVIDVSANKLADLPASLATLGSLKELYLLGNPLRVAPPENPAFATNKNAINAYLTFSVGGVDFAAENEKSRETLQKLFAGVDGEVINSVIENCGSVSQALDFLLSMNAPAASSADKEGTPGRSPRKSLRQSGLSQLTPVASGLRKMLETLTKPAPAKAEEAGLTTSGGAIPTQNKFLQYENENNRMFNTLSTQPEFHDILTILLVKGMTLLVPQDIVLDGIELDRALLMGHTISWDSEEEDPATHLRPFTTTSGTRGHLNSETSTFHLEPGTEAESWEAAVLRQGEFSILGTASPIPIYLISSALGPTTAATPSSSSSVLDSSLSSSSSFDPSSPAPLLKDPKDAGSSTPSKTSHPVPSSASDRDGFDLQLNKPILLDPFINKLQNKAARNLRMSIEQFVKSMQKRGQSIEDQRDYIFRFLESAKQQMLACPLWKGLSRAELNYAEDALETVVYTKIYKSIFYTTSDQERDMMLSAKMKKLQFITPDMLGIPPRFCNRKMWAIAERELLKMNSHCAPKEKLHALINCCKVIIQLLNGAENVAGADDFLPHLCIVVLRAYPPHMHSNVRYISRYVGQNVLVSETLYYYTQVVSVISFIENIEAQHLNLTTTQFQKYMEGHGKSGESAPPVPDHSLLPNKGALHPTSIMSLAIPPPPKSKKVDLRKHARFLECTSAEHLRVGDLQALLDAFHDLANTVRDEKQETPRKPTETTTTTTPTTTTPQPQQANEVVAEDTNGDAKENSEAGSEERKGEEEGGPKAEEKETDGSA